jgi:hypothetical protein
MTTYMYRGGISYDASMQKDTPISILLDPQDMDLASLPWQLVANKLTCEVYYSRLEFDERTGEQLKGLWEKKLAVLDRIVIERACGPSNMIVEHINDNPFDCCGTNLRYVEDPVSRQRRDHEIIRFRHRLRSLDGTRSLFTDGGE